MCVDIDSDTVIVVNMKALHTDNSIAALSVLRDRVRVEFGRVSQLIVCDHFSTFKVPVE